MAAAQQQIGDVHSGVYRTVAQIAAMGEGKVKAARADFAQQLAGSKRVIEGLASASTAMRTRTGAWRPDRVGPSVSCVTIGASPLARRLWGAYVGDWASPHHASQSANRAPSLAASILPSSSISGERMRRRSEIAIPFS